MASARLIRRGDQAGVLGGVCWMAAGLLAAGLPPSEPTLRYILVKLLTVAALLLLSPSLIGLHLRWRCPQQRGADALGRVGMVGGLAGVCCALLGLALDQRETWLDLGLRGDWPAALFGFGLLNLCVGLLLLGAGARRAAQAPGWQSLPLLIGLLGLQGLVLHRSMGEQAVLLVWMLFGLSWSWMSLALRLSAP